MSKPGHEARVIVVTNHRMGRSMGNQRYDPTQEPPLPAQTVARVERIVIAAAVLSILLALFGCHHATPVESSAAPAPGAGGIPNLAGVWRINAGESGSPSQSRSSG